MIKFIVGLVIGIAIAGGLAYYLNNAPTQFVNKVSNTAGGISTNGSAPVVLAPSTKYQVAASNAVMNPRVAPENSDNANASAPSYDFYDVLQGKKSAGSGSDSDNVGTKSARFYLQAGTFSSQDLANDMKARLALMGINARVKSQQSNGKIINRIIIGPFNSEGEASVVLSQLKDNEINATLVKISN